MKLSTGHSESLVHGQFFKVGASTTYPMPSSIMATLETLSMIQTTKTSLRMECMEVTDHPVPS
eukprot:gene6699-7791_t